MPQDIKVGDRIRILEDNFQCAAVKKGDVLTVKKVKGDIITTPSPSGHTWVFNASREGDGFELVKPEPKFSVGQRVRTKLSIWCYGLDEGAVGVVRALSDDPESNFPYKVSFPKKGDGYVFLAESEIEPAPTQEFKLKPGDVVKNLKTGRLGVVVPGYESSPHPERRSSYVIDLKHIPTKDRVPTRLLEEYEAEHPGTYDLVIEENPPW